MATKKNPWTVYQTNKSDSWYVSFSYRDERGVSRRFRHSAGRGVSRTEAERLARTLYRKYQHNPIAFLAMLERRKPAASKGKPFAQVADEYVEQRVLLHLKHTTIRSHRQIIRVHLKPWFKNTDLTTIGNAEVDAYMSAKRHGAKGRKGLSAKSVNNHLSVLSSLFAFAIERGWITENPAKGKRLKVESSGFNWINEAETPDFLASVQATDPDYHLLFLTALRTGMRQGELLALRWQQVTLDAEHPIIEVRYSHSHGKTTSTKGNRPRRVPIHPELRRALASARGEPAELVFTARDGRRLTGNMIKNPMRRAAKAIGRPELRFHDLRHSFASQLTHKGVSLQVVQGLLGHSDVTTTAKYSHPSESLHRSAVGALGTPELREVLAAK